MKKIVLVLSMFTLIISLFVSVSAALTQTEVSQLYIGVFGRASEGDGNSYWQTDPSSTSMAVTANVMLNTAAAKDYFGLTLSNNQDFVEHIYLETLDKTYADDFEGVDYWVSELDGGKSKGEVITALITAAQHPQNAGIAQDLFNNKVAVSNYCAATMAAFTDFATFSSFISSVTDDDATVSSAKELIDLSLNSSDVTGVSLSKSSTSIVLGSNEQFFATISPLNTRKQNVTWSSSNESVATVSTDGLVIAVSAGSATITVTTEDGSFTATCDVTVSIDKNLDDCTQALAIQVLFIGNSYTTSNSLPNLVSQLACGLGYNIEYDSYTPGGFRFLNHKDDNTTLAKINSKSWNFVVLQNQSQVPGWKPADVESYSKPNAETLVNQIKSNYAETEIIYFATWGRQNGDYENCAYYPLVCTFDGHTTALKQGYDIYQSATGGLIASVGSYWRNIVNDLAVNRPFDASILWAVDGSHPDLAGSYLAAATILYQITSAPVSPSTYHAGLDSDTANYILSVVDSP